MGSALEDVWGFLYSNSFFFCFILMLFFNISPKYKMLLKSSGNLNHAQTECSANFSCYVLWKNSKQECFEENWKLSVKVSDFIFIVKFLTPLCSTSYCMGVSATRTFQGIWTVPTNQILYKLLLLHFVSQYRRAQRHRFKGDEATQVWQ